MVNQALLKLFLKKENYQKFYSYVIALDNLDPPVLRLLKTISDYYTENEQCNTISPSELAVYHATLNKHLKPDNYTTELLKSIDAVDVSDQTALGVVKKFMLEQVGAGLVTLGQNFLENNATDLHIVTDYIREISEQINIVEGKDGLDEDYVNLKASDVAVALDDTNGYDWNLACLNKYLGPITVTTQSLVFAEPNLGKTSFAVDLCRTIAKQMNGTSDNILYCGNEQGAPVLQQRMYTSATGIPWEELKLDAAKADQLFVEAGGDRIKHYENVLTVERVEELIDRHRPKVVLIDMHLKLGFSGAGSLNDVKKLQQIAFKTRLMAKKYECAVVGFAQAGQTGVLARNPQQQDKGEVLKWLTQTDVAGSKTDVPGEYDTMIGISSCKSDEYDPNTRFLSVCKDKVNAKRTRFSAILQPDIGRYIDGGPFKFV